jgi:hypothetical protein
VVADDVEEGGASGAAAPAAKGKAKAPPRPSTDVVVAQLSGKRKVTVGSFRGQARARARSHPRAARAMRPHALALHALFPR